MSDSSQRFPAAEPIACHSFGRQNFTSSPYPSGLKLLLPIALIIDEWLPSESTMTEKKKPAKPQTERRSGTDRRQQQRRDSVREEDKGILSTRKEERRKTGRRKEDKSGE
jgi:hypothetical protein